jgi:hypothetical protein
MPVWRLLGVNFGARVGGDRVLYERILDDGTRLIAKVRTADGHPVCDEITATFPDGARDFGRELAISELEQVINESDRHGVMTGDGTIVPILSISEFPLGVPVQGSRGRKPQWDDRRYAELVRDIENGTIERWQLERNTIRQYANKAVKRSIAEPTASDGPHKSWRLTEKGRQLLNDTDSPPN